MSNLCSYAIKANAVKKENIEEFIKRLKGEYDYFDGENAYTDIHYFRVFDADVMGGITSNEDGIYSAEIVGSCAWSVSSCMFGEKHSYYSRMKESCETNGHEFYGTTLLLDSKELELDIEIISEECGMSFMEHYIIKNGELTVDECVDFEDIYADDDPDYENEPIRREGGFEWEFTI